MLIMLNDAMKLIANSLICLFGLLERLYLARYSILQYFRKFRPSSIFPNYGQQMISIYLTENHK